MNHLNAPLGLSVHAFRGGKSVKMRRRKHRGRNKPIDRPLSVEKIENRFEKVLQEKQFLAEAFLLGKNKYRNTDKIPMRATRR